MSLERFKSAIYKSIIICDDPKGVVECRTYRKMKNTIQQMEPRGDDGKPVTGSNKSLVHKSNKAETGERVDKHVIEGNHSPSTFQLLEIAKGAHRLNQMIESWSKGLNADSRPKYVGKDLLNGALDLQESLDMVAKLQESSQCVVMSDKSRDSSERGNREKMADDIIASFQRPRLSTDDSSQRCAVDIKNAIRHDRFRQNPLKDESSKQYCLNQRNAESTSEIPSTSSSQSSTAHTDNFGSIDSSSSSVLAPQNMTDGQNLIVKLMGLEGMPSEQIQTTLHKKWENEKLFNEQKPIVDLDMPRLRESYLGVIKVDPNMRTSKEIHEIQQSKENLKDISGKRLKPHSCSPGNPFIKEKLKSEGSPIVLIKPRLVAGTRSGGSLVPLLSDKESFGTRNIVKKPIMKGRPAGANETPFRLGEKMEMKETFIKRLNREERTLDSRSLPRKPVVREVKAIEKTRNTVKASGRINGHSQAGFVNERRGDKIKKATVTRKEIAVKDPPKSRHVSRPRDRPKSGSIKLRKPENESKITKNQTSSDNSTNLKCSLKNKTARYDSLDQEKNQAKGGNPIRQSKAAISTTDNFRYKNRNKKSDCTTGDHIVPTSTSGSVSQDIPTEESASAKSGSGEYISKDSEPNSVCDGLLEIVENDRDSNSNEAAYDRITNSGSCLKSLLSSSPIFLSHAEEYFDILRNDPIMSHAAGNKDCGIISDRLLLDCANELVKHRFLRDACKSNPLSARSVYGLKISIDLDKLLAEVCDGIEVLTSFCKPLAEDLHADIVHAMLEKDMMSKDAVNGIWDLGRRNGFSVGNAAEIVSHIESLVLNELIEEIFD